MSLTNTDFNLLSVTLEGEEQGIAYPTLLIPDETRVTIHYLLNTGVDEDSCYIKVESGQTYKYYAIADDAAGLVNKTLTITIPSLNSNNINIIFSCNEAVISEEGVVYNEIPDSTSVNYSGYRYPFKIELSESNINRYSDDYSTRSYKGKNIKVEKLLLNFAAGNINDLQSDTDMEIIVTKNSPEIVQENVIIDYDEINQFFSTAGYSDNNGYYLFEDLNDANFFKDTEFSYQFQCKFYYKTIAAGEEAEWIEVIEEFLTEPFSLTNSHSTLQLVGETLLLSGEQIYGGIAIGTDPTIYEIGEPALECGYPAYFNNTIYTESISYGFHRGEQINLIGMTFAGFITSSSKHIQFTIFLGQPIFATAAKLSGLATVRTINGYINGYTASSPHKFNNYELTILNNKCGILQLIVTNSSGFKRATSGSTSTDITNNTPIILSVPSGKDLIINFE